MPRPFPIFSQSDYLIKVVDTNLHLSLLTNKTVQFQNSCLLQKPTDLDLQCLQRQSNPGSAGSELRPVWWGDRESRYTGLTRYYVDDWIWNIRWNTGYRNNSKYWDKHAWAKHDDPDQTTQNAASNRCLHCLPHIQHYLDTLTDSKIDFFVSNFRTSMLRI